MIIKWCYLAQKWMGLPHFSQSVIALHVSRSSCSRSQPASELTRPLMTLPLALAFLIGHALVAGALAAGVTFAFPVVDEALGVGFTLGMVLAFVEVAFVTAVV